MAVILYVSTNTGGVTKIITPLSPPYVKSLKTALGQSLAGSRLYLDLVEWGQGFSAAVGQAAGGGG